MDKILVTRLWIERGHLYACTNDGKIASYELSKFSGFKHATDEQLQDFEVIGNRDFHWPELDEDINLEGMLYDNGLCKLTPNEDSVVFRPLPETNDCVAEEIKR